MPSEDKIFSTKEKALAAGHSKSVILSSKDEIWCFECGEDISWPDDESDEYFFIVESCGACGKSLYLAMGFK